MIKKILIIGGNGFLGYNLAKSLVKSDFKITLLCRKKNKNLKKLSKVNYIFCDITSLTKLRKKIKENYNFVINFSGNISHSNKQQTLRVHYGGLKNLLNILSKKKIDLFIQTGSSLEYSKSNNAQKEKNICKPNSIYGKVKLKASRLLIKDKRFPKYIILRPYQIFGPHQKFDRLIPFVIKNSLKGKIFNCSAGIQERDFLFVEDFNLLIKNILKCKNIEPGIYNVGSGKPISVKKIIKIINKSIGKGTPIFGSARMRQDESKYLFPDISKVKKSFKWSPKINLLKGIKKTVLFYESKKFHGY